jgi:hypothetical protein
MQMEYPLYVPEEEKKAKKHYDLLIPVLLVIVLLFIVYAKLGGFCGIPVLGQIICGGQQIKILVIGDLEKGAPSLYELIKSKGVYYGIYGADTKIDYHAVEGSGAKFLKNYDVVILAGDKYLSRRARDALGEYVKTGGNFLIIGDAGTKDPDDPYINGWSSGELGEVMPVMIDKERTTATYSTGTTALIIVDTEHYIVKGYGLNTILPFDRSVCGSSIKVTPVIPTGVGSIIAHLETNMGKENAQSTPAIVETQSILVPGKIVYVAYDIGCMPDAAISLLKYLGTRNI